MGVGVVVLLLLDEAKGSCLSMFMFNAIFVEGIVMVFSFAVDGKIVLWVRQGERALYKVYGETKQNRGH